MRCSLDRLQTSWWSGELKLHVQWFHILCFLDLAVTSFLCCFTTLLKYHVLNTIIIWFLHCIFNHWQSGYMFNLNTCLVLFYGSMYEHIITTCFFVFVGMQLKCKKTLFVAWTELFEFFSKQRYLNLFISWVKINSSHEYDGSDL